MKAHRWGEVQHSATGILSACPAVCGDMTGLRLLLRGALRFVAVTSAGRAGRADRLLPRRLSRSAGRPPAAESIPTYVEVPCACDGLTHLVTEAAYAAGVVRCRGRFDAVCGRTVLAASLLSFATRRCSGCVEELDTPSRRARPARPD